MSNLNRITVKLDRLSVAKAMRYAEAQMATAKDAGTIKHYTDLHCKLDQCFLSNGDFSERVSTALNLDIKQEVLAISKR